MDTIRQLRPSKRLKFDSTVKLAYDGNSLMYGHGASVGGGTPIPNKLATMAPFSACAWGNVAISGQTWAQMTSAATDVDALFDATKATNVLAVWETTNSVYGYAKTAAQCQADLTAYVAARLAAHPTWKILILGTIPRRCPWDEVQVQVDDWCAANYRAIGAQGFCRLRVPNSPFNHTGEIDKPFVTNQALWLETAEWVHLTGAGYAALTPYVARGLLDLPA